MDGREIKLADPAWSTIEWTLTFSELVDDEIGAIQEFFVSMEGTLGTFTFLDPTDNLLTWSEKLDETVWQADAMLQVTGGLADPFDSTSAWRLANTAGVPRQLSQTLNAPTNYCYSLSLWARSEQVGDTTLLRGAERKGFTTSPDWQRFTFSSDSANLGEAVKFGLELAPGRSLEVFGVQAEPQIGASNYKKTTSRGGVHPMARFSENGLVLTTIAPSRHGCLIRLISE
jgi:hypothetical protein